MLLKDSNRVSIKCIKYYLEKNPAGILIKKVTTR